QHHGARTDVAPEKIILRRAKISEIKVAGTQGAKKTISVQVRKKRTYIKRPLAEEEAAKQKPQDMALEAPIIEETAPIAPAIDIVAEEVIVTPSTTDIPPTLEAEVLVAESEQAAAVVLPAKKAE